MRWFVVLAALALSCGDDGIEGKLPAKPGARNAALIDGGTVVPAPSSRPVSYPESSDGLAKVAGDLLSAVADDDAREEARLVASLRLPDAAAWFQSTFGTEVGHRLTDEYAPLRSEIGQLVPVMNRLVQNGQSVIRVEEFRTPDQPSETGYQSKALASMIKPAALYSVRLATVDGKQVYHLWSFIYVGGTFRYVGKLKAIAAGAPPSGADRLELRLADAAAPAPAPH